MASDDPTAAARPRRPRPVPLAELIEALPAGALVEAPADLAVAVTGVSLSSHRVRGGDLYAALPGNRTHGAVHAPAAVAAGAAAILTDPAGAREVSGLAPVVVVDRPRAALGGISAYVFGDPATAMRMIGVTGTQGKTTVTRLLEEGLLAAGVPAAVIGTVGTRVLGRELPTVLTTPEAPDLHGLFARMREDGVTVCALEVSSHALMMGRVDGVVFDVAVFTNLGRDHLDFHDGMEDYYRAKASLFTPDRARLALVNADDEHGRRLAGETELPVRTYAVDSAADWRATELVASPGGSAFDVAGPGVSLHAGVALPGAFNVSNALAAIAAGGEAGFDAIDLARGIAAGGGVPGRMERVDAGQDFEVVVDYAHKPDAIAAALATLRPLTTGRLLVVLGAGGDRDPGKRPIMGEVAAGVADVLVVTDDNPRSEDPAAIRAAIRTGANGGPAEIVEIGDRRSAIREAVRRARRGDIVLIAGKGHEAGQEVAGVVHPFDDRVVAAEELAAR